MSKSHLISIITINLNNLGGLRKTMKSVFEQSWQEFEYIIIDGGSTDGSKEYIESNSDKIDHWVSEPDKGIFNGMNKGIKRANGEYLLFLNSGDWLYDEKVLNIAAEKLDSCDVFYGNIIKVFPDGREILDKGTNGEEITLETFGNGSLNHPSSFIGKHLFDKYGLYDENLQIVSDWKFFLIALGLNNAKVSYINQPFSYFDVTGISSNNYGQIERERDQVLNKEVPTPILKDFLKLQKIKKRLEDKRYQKFEITDQKKISRKLHSIIFKLFVSK
ncbi:Glycosyltransferase involved in cell wall bisynthesis [Salegentibacter holothuriorum]|uniref:Glycosyltransferase involved in cell wall bisynthesis n=1 Tax=Salegentibacter holothuriorum TaxID=241145 RepID=A0A1T5CLB6_9FLAO|nr:glycosyltransferase family 2 protein [Salegentibacter holothuriorum]SKB60194.1 Glycosyltransferase involved in cell wall bisynthesis [Salegentibacter holothuriorum]